MAQGLPQNGACFRPAGVLFCWGSGIAVAGMEELEKLFYLTGISAEYLDYHGTCRQVPPAWRRRALELLGCDPDDPEALRSAVEALDVAPWRQWLGDCEIVDATRSRVTVRCRPEDLQRDFFWQLTCEAGERREGAFCPGELEETGDYIADGIRYSARALPLGELPAGYHHLQLSVDDARADATLVAAPERCAGLDGDRPRLWGLGCQLYSLRSEHNWGIGDFGDLSELISLASRAGADFVLLNPLHAPCAGDEAMASPYSPSDRRFLNPLALDPAREPEWPEVAEHVLGEPELGELQALRGEPLVDYPRVATLKYRVFAALYRTFSRSASAERRQSLATFVADGGAALEAFVAHECRHNPRVAGQPELVRYLQWCAEAQLAGCQAEARGLGMRLGLVRDLAVGAVGEGAEVQSQPQLYLSGASIGAPPDPLAPQGQSWGLPVLHPLQVRAGDYAAFITLLRRNMRSCGALRVDHAMALLRTWWSLPAEAPDAGLYVYYPSEALMALLRLESRRADCLIIGEDLGVVPAAFRASMRRDGLLGNALLYFERRDDGAFLAPGEQRDDALLMVSNHDVPTLADWWSAGDLLRRERLGLMADGSELEQALEERTRDRQRLLDWLAAEGLRPAGDCDSFDMVLCTAIHRACARGRAPLLMVQLEDLQLLTEPVNIPGTSREYPNWRRKQAETTARIFATPAVRELLAAVARERSA